MIAEGKLDKLLQRISGTTSATPKVSVYVEGVKAKLKQAKFSMERIRYLEGIAEDDISLESTTGPSMPRTLTIDEKVQFYCESLWVSLRAALDILAQLINQLRRLNIQEKDVDIKGVGKRLAGNYRNTLLEKAVTNCLKSRAFNKLERYRHCSTHRRQVYIRTEKLKASISGTPGYYSDSILPTEIVTVKRHICSNPGDIKPKVNLNKSVGDFCEEILNKIDDNIGVIAHRL